MSNTVETFKPLREIFTRGLLFQYAIVFLLVVLVFIFSQVQENNRLYDIEKNRLTAVSNIISRALASELIIKNSEGISILLPLLKERHELDALIFQQTEMQCETKRYFSLIDTHACVTKRVNELQEDYYITAYSKVPSQGLILNSYFLILLIVGIVGFAFYRRTYAMLNKRVIDPIISLANNPTNYQEFDSDVAREVVHIKKMFTEYIDSRDESNSYHEKIKIAKQVAHDIRSPLTALEIILKEAKDIPENKRILLRNAVVSIKSIVANLTKQDKREGESQEQLPGLAFELLESIVIEHQAKLSDDSVDINFVVKDAYCIFVNINQVEFIRVISNIINNAYEAITCDGKIRVCLSKVNGQAVIEIQDNGSGIPEDKINNIFEEGVTFDKPDGSGMGLTIVADYIRKWGATYHIESMVDIGTKFTIKLPLVAQPAWFLDHLYITPEMTVVVIDDDDSIHSVWRERFSVYLERQQINLIHIRQKTDLYDLEHYAENVIYLVDYELIGHSKNGLQLIEELGVENQAVLVTSHSSSESLRKQCEVSGVKIVPKNYSVHIPIIMTNDTTKPSYVLLDDDVTITLAWEFMAKAKKVSLKTFNDIAKFDSYILSCPKDVEVYIDYELGEDLVGDAVAKTLYDKGFKNVYIATGHDPDTINKTPWVKAVVNKMAPF